MSVSENEISDSKAPEKEPVFYRLQFREGGQQSTGAGAFPGLIAGTVVMVRTDHGIEPARIAGPSPICGCKGPKGQPSYEIDCNAQGGDAVAAIGNGGDNRHAQEHGNLHEAEQAASCSRGDNGLHRGICADFLYPQREERGQHKDPHCRPNGCPAC